MITRRLLAAMLVVPILAASLVQANGRTGQQANRQSPGPQDPKTSRPQALLEQAKADWFAMRTKSAEQALISATKIPATAAEAHYWLGRIYDFKGNKAEGAFPGFHEEVSYRPRAAAEFKAAGTPRPEWILEADGLESSLKAADLAIAKLQADPQASAPAIRDAIDVRIKLRPDPMAYIAASNMLLARNADLPFVLRLAADGKIRLVVDQLYQAFAHHGMVIEDEQPLPGPGCRTGRFWVHELALNVQTRVVPLPSAGVTLSSAPITPAR